VSGFRARIAFHAIYRVVSTGGAARSQIATAPGVCRRCGMNSVNWRQAARQAWLDKHAGLCDAYMQISGCGPKMADAGATMLTIMHLASGQRIMAQARSLPSQQTRIDLSMVSMRAKGR
jgi:hypothetical protein